MASGGRVPRQHKSGRSSFLAIDSDMLRRVEREPGGYDYVFIETVQDRLICKICTKPMRDPQLVVCCGQHFCESCLKHSFKTAGRDSCPHCRAQGKSFQHVIDRGVKSEIEQLNIECTNKTEGCEWTGELGAVGAHLNSDNGCQHQMVPCINNCKINVKRMDLEKHLRDDCVLRAYNCEHCNKQSTFKAIIGSHYDTCLKYPLQCPNECGESNIKRESMRAHRSQCPLEPVECPNRCRLAFKHTGGRIPPKSALQNQVIRRRDLETHLRDMCVLRKYTCQHCGIGNTYKVITGGHYEKCLEYPLDCPNEGCGIKDIKRKDMEAHRNQCPREMVDCPYKEVGCQVRMPRCEIGTHPAVTQEHLDMAMEAYRKKSEELQQKETENQQMSRRLMNGYMY